MSAHSNAKNNFSLICQASDVDTGEGLFTMDNIPANVTVIQYEGVRRACNDHKDHTDCFEYDSQTHLVGTGLARYIKDVQNCPNRSANLRFKFYHPAKTVYLVSNRKIFAGSELTASFGDQYWKVNKLEQLNVQKEEDKETMSKYEFDQLLLTDKLVFGEEVIVMFNEGQLRMIIIGVGIDLKILDKLNKEVMKTKLVEIKETWITDYGNLVGVRWF